MENGGFLRQIRDELTAAGIFVVVSQGAQAGLFLLMMSVFSSQRLFLPILLTSVLILVGFLYMDGKFSPETGRNRAAFRGAVGYIWVLVAFLFSLIGFIGGKIASCEGKRNCTTDYLFEMMKIYAVITIVQVIILSGIAAIVIFVKRRKALEARKTISMHISKPKTSGN